MCGAGGGGGGGDPRRIDERDFYRLSYPFSQCSGGQFSDLVCHSRNVVRKTAFWARARVQTGTDSSCVGRLLCGGVRAILAGENLKD